MSLDIGSTERHDLCQKYDPSGRGCWCESAFRGLAGKTVESVEATGQGVTLFFRDGYILDLSEGDWHVTSPRT